MIVQLSRYVHIIITIKKPSWLGPSYAMYFGLFCVKRVYILYLCVDTDYDVYDVVFLRWFQLSFFKLYFFCFGNGILDSNTVKHLQHK